MCNTAVYLVSRNIEEIYIYSPVSHFYLILSRIPMHTTKHLRYPTSAAIRESMFLSVFSFLGLEPSGSDG